MVADKIITVVEMASAFAGSSKCSLLFKSNGLFFVFV
jgi:hypothetical protein